MGSMSSMLGFAFERRGLLAFFPLDDASLVAMAMERGGGRRRSENGKGENGEGITFF